MSLRDAVMPALFDAVMAPLDGLRRRVVPRAAGRVLEVGSGTGLNLCHYGPLEALVCLDPDLASQPRAARRAQGLACPRHVVAGRAELLPLADRDFDSVVMTFVLCSVRDPLRALVEARRVLRPGGLLLFAEHVRGAGLEARLQDALAPAWSAVAAGCQLNRDTPALVVAAGFGDVELHRPRRWLPLFPFALGSARRPG